MSWGTAHCCESTLLPTFLPHALLFLLTLMRFTSCCTCRFCNRKGESSHHHTLLSCVVEQRWSPRGHLCPGATSEPATCEAAWDCLYPVLGGNFRKVSNELLNFMVKKSSLVAPVWFARWTLAALLVRWQIPTHCSGIHRRTSSVHAGELVGSPPFLQAVCKGLLELK